MPTFLPGCMRVPRWRTIILPARIDCEPNILTPSRLDSESRPLRDEPPAFLCAIYIAFIPQWKPFHYRLCRCAVLYRDRKSTRLNSSHQIISYAVFCLKKKKKQRKSATYARTTKTLNRRRQQHIAPVLIAFNVFFKE